jgi:V8-like Glu-specific endopeptidase
MKIMSDKNLPNEPRLRDLAVGVQVIIDNHPLVQVPDPQAQQYRRIGYLRSHATGGRRRRGTGTLIAAGDAVGILTCAHNLYDPGVAGPVDRIEFFPAKTGAAEPYGVINAGAAMLRIPDGYLADPDPGNRHDYAVVRLDLDQIPAGFGPLATMAVVPVEELDAVQVTGYPDVEPPQPNQVMYYSRGATLNDPTDTGLLRYNASTMGGSSGSPVCRMRTGQGGIEVPELDRVFAVHVDGDRQNHEYNWGVYLTAGIIQWIAGQMAH